MVTRSYVHHDRLVLDGPVRCLLHGVQRPAFAVTEWRIYPFTLDIPYILQSFVRILHKVYPKGRTRAALYQVSTFNIEPRAYHMVGAIRFMQGNKRRVLFTRFNSQLCSLSSSNCRFSDPIQSIRTINLMASRRITIYDLTGDSCGDENIRQNTQASTKSTITRQPAREPLEVLQNQAKPAPKSISTALKSAIATLSDARIREELETLCSQHEAARCDLERKLLVKGREVSRYHADSESENEKIEDEESDEDSDEDSDRKGSNIVNSRSQSQKSISSTLPIGVADDELTPRYAKCENCKKEFDVTDNKKRWCHWHSGIEFLSGDVGLGLINL